MSVEIHDFWFRYEESKDWALKGVNLSISEGEAVGIVGPSGSGKSTLLMAISGIIPSYIRGEQRGSVSVDGIDPGRVSLPEMATRVGIVLQDPELQLFMPKVIEEVAFGPENLCLPPQEILKRVRASISEVGLEGLEERDTYKLSAGQKQRVAIASMLSMGQRVLLMDEPLSRLDRAGRESIIRVINALKKRGVTVIVSEHHVNELAKVVDRLVLLSGGAVMFDAPVIEVINKGLSGSISALTRPPIRHCVDSATARPQKQTAGQPIIEVEDLYYEYADGVKALSSITLKVYHGEFLGIFGENGSGKSTLLKIIAGLLRPKKGRVVVDGMENPTAEDLIGKVMYVPENPDRAIFEETVFEEVAFTVKRLGFREDEVNARVKWALDLVNLSGFESRDPLALSFGERRRVTVATAIAVKPKVLLLDEPTTGLDLQNAIKLMDSLKKLQIEHGTTIIVVSHELELVKAYADRSVEMKSGNVVS